MRLGETYLIAAEAAGRKGDYNLAADLINIIRERASWKAGEKRYLNIGQKKVVRWKIQNLLMKI